jgi:hypothetical protein
MIKTINVPEWKYQVAKVLSIVFFVFAVLMANENQTAKDEIGQEKATAKYLTTEIRELTTMIDVLEAKAKVQQDISNQLFNESLQQQNEILHRPIINISDSTDKYVQLLFEKYYGKSR